MAFDIQYLSPVGNQSKRGRTAQHFTYRTTDTLADVQANNYFAAAKSMLEAGDHIEVVFVDSLTAPTIVSSRTILQVALNITGLILALDIGYRTVLLSGVLPSVTAGGTVAITSQVAGTIEKITAVLGGPITTGNLVLTANIGGTDITDGATTVPNGGSALGTTVTQVPSALNVLAVGDVLNNVKSGTAAGVVPCYVFYFVTV